MTQGAYIVILVAAVGIVVVLASFIMRLQREVTHLKGRLDSQIDRLNGHGKSIRELEHDYERIDGRLTDNIAAFTTMTTSMKANINALIDDTKAARNRLSSLGANLGWDWKQGQTWDRWEQRK